MPVMVNKNRPSEGESVIVTHDVANVTYVVAGNTSVSNLSSNGYTVEGLSVSKVWYGAQTGAHWVMSRGANTVGVYGGTGELHFDGALLNKFPSANLVLTLQGGTVGFIMVEGKLKQHAGE